MRSASSIAPDRAQLGPLEHAFGSSRALEQSERELRRMLEAHGIFFGDGLLPTCADAFVAPADKLARWSSQAERLVGTMEKLATELDDDTAFCASLGLDPEA